MGRYENIRSMKNTSEIVKLRNVIERIEKKLDKAFKILEDDTKRI
jgi:hypothetical protein